MVVYLFPCLSVSLVDHTVHLLFQRALFLFYYSTLQIPQRAVIGSREKCKYPRQKPLRRLNGNEGIVYVMYIYVYIYTPSPHQSPLISDLLPFPNLWIQAPPSFILSRRRDYPGFPFPARTIHLQVVQKSCTHRPAVPTAAITISIVLCRL